MKTDAKVCIGTTIAIVASVGISANVFHMNVTRPLSLIGFIFLIGLPTYIFCKRRKKQKADEIVWRSIGDLGTLDEHMRDYGGRGKKYIDDIRRDVIIIQNNLHALNEISWEGYLREDAICPITHSSKKLGKAT